MQILSPAHFSDAFPKIGDQWMLIVTRNNEKINAMTASWGGFGVLWNQSVATIYVRPQRHTRTLLDASETFTLCFLPEAMRDVHKVTGAQSGRDVDKIEVCNLTPQTEDDFTYLGEAESVLCCRKLFVSEFREEGFVDPQLVTRNYPEKDFHRMYVGGIEKVFLP